MWSVNVIIQVNILENKLCGIPAWEFKHLCLDKLAKGVSSPSSCTSTAEQIYPGSKGYILNGESSLANVI